MERPPGSGFSSSSLSPTCSRARKANESGMMQYLAPLVQFREGVVPRPFDQVDIDQTRTISRVGTEIRRFERLCGIQAENDHAGPGLHGGHAELPKLLCLRVSKTRGCSRAMGRNLSRSTPSRFLDRVDPIEGQTFRQACHERVGQPLAVRVGNKHGVTRNFEEAVHAQPDRQRHGGSERSPEVCAELVLEQVPFEKQHLRDRRRKETLHQEHHRGREQHQPQDLRRQSRRRCTGPAAAWRFPG